MDINHGLSLIFSTLYDKKATPSHPPTPRNCLFTLNKFFFHPCSVFFRPPNNPPCHSPKSSIFWLKFGIKIPFQTPTTLDFPTFFQKNNFLPCHLSPRSSQHLRNYISVLFRFYFPKAGHLAQFFFLSGSFLIKSSICASLKIK